MSLDYLLVVLVTISIYAILVVSLNIVAGYAGQPNLAQGAFFGIGAYFAAVLSVDYGWSFWWTIPAAVGTAGIAGLVLGAISLRLREDFLAVTTIGLNFVVVAMFQYVPFFGGATGVYAIPLPSIAGHQFGAGDFLIVGLAMLLLVVGISWYMERTWFGAAIIAIRDDEAAAAATGIPVAPYKIAAFVLGSALAGLAGALYAPFLSAVTPTSFGFSESVVILAMLMFGGIGVISGAIFGAVVLGALPEVFRFVSDFRLLAFGAILVLVLRFQPEGLLGEGSAVRRLLRGTLDRMSDGGVVGTSGGGDARPSDGPA
ncbi:MAG: branched-chain amino acid ABC transporter permease [Candidatus Limnocylindrales bacterium]